MLFVYLQVGIVAGCVSPLLSKLTAPDSPIPMNKDEASWMASLANMGRFCGAVIGSILAAYYGTKRSLFIISIPVALGWLAIGLASSIEILYLGRVLTGFGVGMSFSCFPLYLGEIAVPKIRGAMVSLATCGGPLGLLLGSATSNYFSVNASAFVYFGFSLAMMGFFIYLPESPHHLIKVDNRQAAKDSIFWYRSGKGVQDEIEAVEKFVASESKITLLERLRHMRNPSIRKATYHVIILFTFMQICGLNSILFYLEIILRKAQCNIINPGEMVIYINLFSIGAALISMLLNDKFGRRFLMLLSSIGIVISMIMMMSHFLIIDYMDFDVSNLQWLPITAMILFTSFFSVGFNSVPSTVTSEIIPSNVKCIVGCLGSLTAGLVAFASSKTYQPMVDSMGDAYVFLTYGLISSAAIPYVLFFMPETKGKTLQEIQDELMND